MKTLHQMEQDDMKTKFGDPPRFFTDTVSDNSILNLTVLLNIATSQSTNPK